MELSAIKVEKTIIPPETTLFNSFCASMCNWIIFFMLFQWSVFCAMFLDVNRCSSKTPETPKMLRKTNGTRVKEKKNMEKKRT